MKSPSLIRDAVAIHSPISASPEYVAASVRVSSNANSGSEKTSAGQGHESFGDGEMAGDAGGEEGVVVHQATVIKIRQEINRGMVAKRFAGAITDQRYLIHER
ncbi:MAG: hypothetical protein A4E35_01560 [Methanoregula sp. PtaU1.Bin051]|nr:MAG: hypothetical protein A4E35_01560 [Methanoregula sp. PtaU1.Bin051]